MASDVVRQELESELKGIEQRFNAIQWRLDEVLSLLLTARRRASNSSSAASSTNTSPSSSPRGPSPELTSPRGKTSSSQNVKLISQASSSSSPSSPSSQSDLSPDSGKGGSSDSNSSSGRARRHRASSGKDLKDEDGDGEVGIVKDNQVDTRGKVLPTRRTSSKGKDVTPVAKKKPMSAREKRRKKQGRGRSYSADDLEEVLKMNAEGMVSDDDYYASSSSSPTSSSSSSGRTSSTSSSPSSSPHDGLTRSAGASGRTASSSSNSRKVPPIPLGQLRSQSTTDLRSSKEEADGKSRGRVRTDSRGIDRSPSQELIDISGPSSPGMSRHREWRKFIKGRTSNLLSPRQEAKFLEREKDKDKERDKDRTEKEKEREKTKDNEDEVADEEASPARHSPKEEGGSSPKRTFASIASEARRNAQARRCQSSDDLQVHRQILAAKKAKPPPEVPPLLLPKRNSPKANPSIASKSSSHVPHIPARGSGAVKTRSDAYKAHSALYASSPATQLVSSSSSSSSAPTKARTSSFSQPTTPDPSPRHSPKSLAVAPPPPDFVMPEMPPEVWEMIFVYIPTEEVFTTTSLVCHLWRDRLLYLVRRFRISLLLSVDWQQKLLRVLAFLGENCHMLRSLEIFGLLKVKRKLLSLDMRPIMAIDADIISKIPPQITTLRLVKCNIAGSTFSALPTSLDLRVLGLSGCSCSCPQLFPFPQRLTHLYLSELKFEDDMIAEIPSTVTHLKLAWTRVTDAGIALLPRSLEFLDVSWCNVSDACLASLPSGLKRLRCNGTNITSAGLKAHGATFQIDML